MAFRILQAFTVFSSFSIIVGDILQRATAVAIDQRGTDGEQFVKRIVHGEKISDNPGYLLFTAPYKLCEGSCEDEEDNFAMAFPIYVGKKGKEKYKELYERDYNKIHSTKPYAPFKNRPTKKLFTLCPSEVTKEATTTETETILTETFTIIPTTPTPTFIETETPAPDTLTVTEKTITETPENPTVSKTEPTQLPTTEIPVSETEPTYIPTTEKPVSETTVTTMTAALTTKPPVICVTLMPSTVLTTIAPTTAVTEESTVAITEAITVKENTMKTESNEITNMPTTAIPEITETEDITFESYTDYTNANYENELTTIVTNADGIRCPFRICKKKVKVTPAIITLVRNNQDKVKLDTRNAQWNSDYSDLQDYSDLY